MMSDYSGVAPPQNLNQSSAFAAALQRARQIAAKINPGSASGSSELAGQKRSHEEGSEDFEPDIKKVATGGGSSSNSSIGSVGATAQTSAAVAAATGIQGLGLNGPVSSEDIKVPDKMVGLIIGRGGEQISRLQAESGCKIQMAMDSGGAPERLCTLTGNPQALSRAKEMIASLISQRSKTEGLGGARLDELGLGDSNSNDGHGGGHSDMDRGGSMMGHGMQSQGGFHHSSTFEMMVPGPKVGLIIGKGGETIKQLQEKSGTKMVVVQDGPNQETEKPLRISGDPQKVEHAKSLIYELLAGDRRDDRGGRGGGGGGGGGGRMGFDRGGGGRSGGGNRWGDQSESTYVVPANKCGIIIGRGGETIKQINQTSGAHCELDRRAPPTATEKTFLIRGQPDQIETAKRMIAEKLGSIGGQDQNGGGPQYGGGMPGGGPPPGAPQFAPQNWGGGGGGGPQGFQQPWGNPQQTHDPNMFGAPQNNQVQVQVNPQTGQPDYSAQWAEYYRSVGMLREAEAIEQQAKANKGMPTGPQGPTGQQPSAQPAAAVAAAPGQGAQNGQADYSAQWAEYYRSTGKVKEAEYIEQQMKSKAAAAAGPAAAPQPAAAAAMANPYAQPQPYGYGGAPAGFYGAAQNPAAQPQYPGYPGFPQAYQMQAPGQGMAPDGQ